MDYVAECVGVLATSMLSLGRFVQDMLLWSTAEFGFLRLSDGYVQTSSIMPQKRNPVPLEHARILASRALTEAQAVTGSLHNTPFADMNDGEDALQPLVALAFDDGVRALTLLAGALAEAQFDTAHMRKRAHGSFLTVTEVADTLVRKCGVSFHVAHGIVAAAVKNACTDDAETLAVELQAEAQAAGVVIDLASVRLALDPDQFVAIRAVRGGPGATALEPALHEAAQQLAQDSGWHAAQVQHLADAHATLMARCATLAT